MLRIYKYTLRVDDIVDVEMVRGAQILSVADQDGDPRTVQLWAEVEPDVAETAVRRFRIAGTGHIIGFGDVAQRHRFVGTVVTHGGALVWHVYDLGEVE